MKQLIYYHTYMFNIRSLRLVLGAALLVVPLFTPASLTSAAIIDQQWTSTTVSGAPAARRGHSSVWTGSEMIVWGGELSGGGCSVNTGASYNPLTDSWTPISNVNAPPMRRGHSAVWSGDKMIVWGGEACNSGPTYNGGGIYDPATDSWTTMSVINAPSGRYTHTAVWSGSEMIVWGGDEVSPGVISTNTGGRYDPATDTWVPLSISGAPSARSHVTGFWTGSRLIVWGGSDNCCTPNGETPSGGVYDPVTDSWSSMAPGDANAGFKFHSAAWTGEEMIVWGGYKTGNIAVNTGQRYNPTTNSWSPMSTVNAPSARGYITAIWSGTEFFVWGGYDGSIPFLNDGGLYNPTTDTWTVTASLDAPSHRDANTLVSTGDSVILWGGFNYDGSSHFLNTGAVFEYQDDTPTGPALSDFILLGSEGVWVKKGSTINSGNIGANNSSADVEVNIEKDVSATDSSSSVFGDSVVLKSGSQINNIYYNDFGGGGVILGDLTSPLLLPVIAEFPSVPNFNAGVSDVKIKKNTSQILSPGSYGALKVERNATLTFTGGEYNFGSINVQGDAQLSFDSATEIRVSGKFSTNTQVMMAPSDSADIDASDIKIFVTGVNGEVGDFDGTPSTVEIGMRNTVHANIYAPNGTLLIKKDTIATGSFIGKWVIIGSNTALTLNSGF